MRHTEFLLKISLDFCLSRPFMKKIKKMLKSFFDFKGDFDQKNNIIITMIS